MAKENTQLSRNAVSVVAQNVSKSFGTKLLFSDINFEVKAGQIFVLMGPSGSGKSVLLKNIIGLEPYNGGKILIEGEDTLKSKTHKKYRTALVFQSGALFNSMSLFDNLALYPSEHQLYERGELEERVFDVLKILGLEDSAYKMPSELSGGMKKRAAIARALIMQPQLILYDEPTSELDPLNAAIICEVIGTLREQFGVTTIVVSHDKTLAMTIADQVGILMNGKLEEVNTSKGIEISSNKSVQEFLNPKINIDKPRFKHFINH